jgi:hypothetical protein
VTPIPARSRRRGLYSVGSANPALCRPRERVHAPRGSGSGPPPRSAGLSSYLYFWSISQTDFWTSRWTIVSSETPPFCAWLKPSAPEDVAPISIFSSV